MFKVETLHQRTGSKSPLREFRRMLKGIIENQEHIPDYTFVLDGNTVHIYPKGEFQKNLAPPNQAASIDKIILNPATLEKAKHFAGKFDVYFAESEWRSMLFNKKSIPENAEGSFISYVKWYAKNN
ncbi:hypothetical protein BMR07_13110 [Methylococcaceae bacterium CS1]|nr:hypothetical protein BMR11_15760 [Methylococcaceae bacterium CS5]TXL03041.1 hypothetical protein BMR07_16300 [Methylococcaceae bacterium CS1]TXL04200.1 hypothetical protein BMR07_13110 [Methylococcaceae bacterium CS1]TXL07001.1 hypothetical protein BMR08_15090 [Methylococcaceae bacterium CS2]